MVSIQMSLLTVPFLEKVNKFQNLFRPRVATKVMPRFVYKNELVFGKGSIPLFWLPWHFTCGLRLARYIISKSH